MKVQYYSVPNRGFMLYLTIFVNLALPNQKKKGYFIRVL